ncbi:nucleotide excision repair endonuclease [Peribacillus muralis]|uniref:nucleotide excision repair endonuclease n=1 Tax=Peribacillus muralis TaxID=264697 RepID=UPI001F4D5E20|nr:nucleotide excision repair endonuclease [Peribacillus muralis]MCK1994213.1 nucleotide excision repair endonuclease [Peribacillus muralis]MCK2015002.1 nucleotide excision repair endonuclease [Peribacillus muralis]
MITIEIPAADISIKQRKQVIEGDEAIIPEIYGFIDFHLIPRDKGGIILFYNERDELIFVGKARKLRPRVKKHFEDNVSPIKEHRNEVKKIDILIVEDPMEREIYETYMINSLRAKYNVDKVFYK